MRLRAVALLLAGIALFFGGLAFHAALRGHVATVEVSFSEPEASLGTQIFFASAGAFSEQSSAIARSPTATWRMRVPRDRTSTLRLDPPTGSNVSICSLDIRSGRGVLTLSDYRVAGFHQIADIRKREQCLVITPVEDAPDPQVLFELVAPPLSPDRASMTAWLALGLIFAIAAIVLVRRASPTSAGTGLSERIGGQLVAVYIVISLAFGAAYAIITPPGAVPDEYAHVTKAVKITNGVLVGSTGERLFPNIFEMYGGFNGYLDPSLRFSVVQLLSQIEAPVPCEATTAALPHGADGYAPHLYAIPAASYAFSCATGQDLGTFLLLARLGNLLLATLLVAIGMWATMRARWALFVCALLPMSFFQLASVSVDAMYLALTFAWVGAVCGVIEERISVQKAVWLLGPLALALAISKPGSAWVLSAILLARPTYIRAVGSFMPAALKFLVLPFAVHFAWVLYAAGSAAPLEGVDPGANLARLIGHPLDVAKVFAQTFFGSHGLWLWKSSLGVLGWLDVNLSRWSYLGLTGCVFAARWMSLKGGLEGWRPWLAFAFSAGAAFMLALPLFLFWTYPDSIVVMGLQGRYFIPCIVFSLCFLARETGARVRTFLSICVPVVIMLALADGLVALIQRYYF